MSRKFVIIVAGLLLSFIIIGTLGYVYYLSPRLRVKSFTGDISPIISQDIKLSNELNDYIDNFYFESISSTNKEPNYLKLQQQVREVSRRLDSAKSDYENLLSDVNKLDSSSETENLKQSVVELNEFYVEKIPEAVSYFIYFDGLISVSANLDKSINDSSVIPEGATLEQLNNMLNNMSLSLDSAKKELDKLKVPAGFLSMHASLTSMLVEGKTLMDETLQAMKDLDIEKLELMENKFSTWENKYNVPSSEKLWKEQFDKEWDTEVNKETEIIDNVQNEMKALENKYGPRWVPEDLNFPSGLEQNI